MSRSSGYLVIDVGNSSTSIGWYTGGRIVRTTRIQTAQLAVRRVENSLRELARGSVADAAALASVVPKVNGVLEKAVWKVFRTSLRAIDHRMHLGARISYPHPEHLGADRLANLAGGVARYGTPLIVVDIGTATTFDVILPRKGYAGGVIAPGPDLMLAYLAEKTALLPALDLSPVKGVIGRTTGEAMRLGAIHGYRGMLQGITHHILARHRGRMPTLCATGGYARWILAGTNLSFVYDRDLTLFGIARIIELNP